MLQLTIFEDLFIDKVFSIFKKFSLIKFHLFIFKMKVINYFLNFKSVRFI
ncbi:hypothetical protein A1OE_1486 [Candidatus Endolissoclinum faulkneri L2]|uniref:Uncharacterized protein n=1 Tax=Candidatus Endolissoclinum faulkneri L2 TaxID=1193729 RepID=K7YJ34_9PROT|nr:hypothetical protein A1OE_1486 [Candidatus Endolissoclinum faulkneri L2]